MLVKFVRKVLPGRMLRRLENGYRRLRVKLVSARYGNPSKHLRVIAVTGTNGKTTTSCYINEILKEAHFTTAMFTTAVIEVAGKRKLNDLNATVASTARMQRFFRDAKRANVDYVVLEVTSHALDQHKLDGVPIEAAVMTNLTQDHLDYHKTMEEYAAAKSKLFQLRPRFIVLNRDDEWYDYFNQFVASEQKMTYGRSVEAEAKITHVKLYRKGTEADVVLDHQTHLELATNLPGEFNVMNMTAATTLAYLLGVKLEDIQEGVANVEAVPGRFERAVEGLGYDVIVDYAHTPDALEKLLAAARGITKQRVILVFGACGDRDQGKRPIMGEIAARGADRIFLTDEESYNEDPEQIRRMLKEGIERGRGDAKTTEIADRIVNGQRLPWNDGQVVREIVGRERAA